MKTITFYVVAALCLIASKLNAQDTKTFEQRAAAISKNIETITKQQKDSLKLEVDRINGLLEKNEITKEEADRTKQVFAESRAKKIETQVAVEQEKLDQLVKDKVDGKIAATPKKSKFTIIWGNDDCDSCDTIKKKEYDYKRTTSQFVFAIGLNRLMADGKVDNDNYEWRSEFYEWGVSWNSRILKNNNLLHAKYGLSLQYNNLRASDNKMFATVNNTTVLVDSGRNLDMARLRYVNLVIPAHLEFDFTKKRTNGDKIYYPTHDSFRIGIGGYVGVNVKEKQKLRFDDEDFKVRGKDKGDYNVNDFVYGLSAYIGYGEVSLYAKYDLQPVFNNAEIDQNNVSLGIRFDFN